MMNSLPAGFTPLEAASQTLHKSVNIIGFVTDYLPPRKTGGTDWQITVSLGDATSFGSGWRLIFFRREEKSLPAIERVGDVVVVKNIQYKSHRGSSMFLSNHGTECTVFPADSMPEKQIEDGMKLEYKQDPLPRSAKYVPTEALMKYAWSIWDSRRYEIPTAGQQATSNTYNDTPYQGKQGFKLLEQVGDGGFYDIIGQVVKLWDPQGSSRTLSMYVTDYTSHSLFYNHAPIGEAEGNDGNQYGYSTRRESSWQGPPGQFTITIDVWDAHADWCRKHLFAKDYVRLRNVNITTGRDGSGKLEGKMRGDRSYPAKVNVEKIKQSELHAPDEDLKELLLRKRDFIEQFGSWEKGESHRGKKRKVVERSGDQHEPEVKKSKSSGPEARDSRPSEQPEQPMTKAAKKRMKKKQKALAAAAAAADSGSGKENIAPIQGQKGNVRDNNASDDTLIPKPRAQIRAEYDKLNNYVATSHQNQPLWKVSDIINHECRRDQLQNNEGGEGSVPANILMFSTEVRVVDYYPRDLRKFAIRERMSEFDCLREDDDGREADDFSSYNTASDSSDDEQAKSLPGDTDDEEQIYMSHKWVWQFRLLVQDSKVSQTGPPKYLHLIVRGEGAEFLLQGLEPCNLCKPKNEQTLAQLQYKLSILWGNLQEKKEEAFQQAQKVDLEGGQQTAPTATSNNTREANDALHARRPWVSGLNNRPFRCCIKAFTTRDRSASANILDGKGGKPRWRLKHQIFDTTIKA